MEELTKYEITRLIAARTLQLAFGAPPLVKVKKGMTPFEVALKEWEEGVIPLFVIREKSES